MLLDVKSFKRKYSEMFRRTILPSEREYLLEKCNLAKNLAPHLHSDLTALRAVDVHDLIANDYPSVYAVRFFIFINITLSHKIEYLKSLILIT